MSTSEVIPISQSPRSVAGSFSPGTFVDSRYEVVRPIAKGELAEIVEANHVNTGRSVVLKLLRRELVDRPEAVARMKREARALGTVQHPNVIAIFDAGICKTSGPFSALEKLDGRSLDGLLTARGFLGVDGALTVLRSVLAALTEVHRQGFVHRDVRPANVFVSASRVGGESVKLLDFGVAGGMTSGNGNRLTVACELPGTLGFSAPEQMADRASCDARSDLYAAGVLFLACLGVGPDQLFRHRADQHRAHAALAGRNDVPPAVLDLLDDLLAQAADERPPSAEAALDRLGSHGEPPTALLGYAPAAPDGDRPTLCEPASKRSRPRAEESRRRHLRAPYITPVRIISASEPIDGRTEDISSSGLLVVARGEVRLEGPVIVRFALPTTGRVVAVQASPKWTREQSGRTAIGLEFMNIERVAAEAIESYAQFVAVER